MHILWLIGFTLGAWLFHAGLAIMYGSLLEAKSLPFRVVHGLEIAATVFIMLIIYYAIINPASFPAWQIAAVILGTLLVVDGSLLIASEGIRHRFDLFHFIVAYAAVAVSVIVFAQTQR